MEAAGRRRSRVRPAKRSGAPASPGSRSGEAATLKREILEFVAGIDALADLLTPPRRPEDLYEPECSRTELRILSALGRVQPLTMTALARSLRIPLSTATRAVGKLVSKRLVARRRGAQDRRIVEVAFSPRGKAINRFVARARSAIAREMLERLRPAERSGLIAALMQLTGASGRTDAGRAKPQSPS